MTKFVPYMVGSETPPRSVLGKEVMDCITLYTGICTGFATYLFGCRQFNIVPRVSADGVLKEQLWFDEGRIRVIGDGIPMKVVPLSNDNGGPNRESPGKQG